MINKRLGRPHSLLFGVFIVSLCPPIPQPSSRTLLYINTGTHIHPLVPCVGKVRHDVRPERDLRFHWWPVWGAHSLCAHILVRHIETPSSSSTWRLDSEKFSSIIPINHYYFQFEQYVAYISTILKSFLCLSILIKEILYPSASMIDGFGSQRWRNVRMEKDAHRRYPTSSRTTRWNGRSS